MKILSIVGPVVFLVATAYLVLVDGIMLSRELVFLWLMAGLLAMSLADLGGWARGVIRDWVPFFAALFVYDLLRGMAGDPIFTPHVYPQIDADRLLFGGQVPTVWLQEHFFGGPGAIHLWDVIAWAIYLTHFFAVYVIAALLWRFSRERFLRFRNLVLSLTAAAFVTYVMFPAVPPWMASDQGAIGSADRVVAAVWQQLGIESAEAIWQRGSAFANEVAAVPSLHAAYPVMIMLFFWGSGRWARIACATYAVAMSLTLVYAGEHYVTDVLLGWIYALAVFFAYERVSAAWRRRRGGIADADAPEAFGAPVVASGPAEEEVRRP